MQKKRKTENQTELGASTCCLEIGEVLEPRFFKALCDPMRVGLFVNLARKCGPAKVSEVADCCPVDLSVVSRHLALLRDAGIVEAKKKGREVYYEVRFSELVNKLRRMAEAIENCCQSVRIEKKEKDDEKK